MKKTKATRKSAFTNGHNFRSFAYMEAIVRPRRGTVRDGVVDTECVSTGGAALSKKKQNHFAFLIDLPLERSYKLMITQ